MGREHMNAQLLAFARQVLRTLEESDQWDSGTLQAIADDAHARGFTDDADPFTIAQGVL